MEFREPEWLEPSPTIRAVLKEIFPSEEMSAYLSEQSILDDYLANAVVCAPISLERKRSLLLSLAAEERTPFFAPIADTITLILQDMEMKPGEVLLMRYCVCDEYGKHDEIAIELFLTWEHLMERIEEYLTEEGEDYAWFDIEKWAPGEAGKLEEIIDYTIVDRQVRYAYGCNDCYKNFCDFATQDLRIQHPFHTGDVVTIDCQPYAPPFHALLLDKEDYKRDCCSLQALVRSSDGSWDANALRHGFAFPKGFDICALVELSPLYRISTVKGELPEDEKLLGLISQYLDGDDDRGEALWNYVHKGVTTDVDILDYIKKNENK
jgi:hypothetical protein